VNLAMKGYKFGGGRRRAWYPIKDPKAIRYKLYINYKDKI